MHEPALHKGGNLELERQALRVEESGNRELMLGSKRNARCAEQVGVSGEGESKGNEIAEEQVDL